MNGVPLDKNEGAGLLLKSFIALHNVALGFRPENVLLMESAVPSSGSRDRQTAGFYERLLSIGRERSISDGSCVLHVTDAPARNHLPNAG